MVVIIFAEVSFTLLYGPLNIQPKQELMVTGPFVPFFITLETKEYKSKPIRTPTSKLSPPSEQSVKSKFNKCS